MTYSVSDLASDVWGVRLGVVGLGGTPNAAQIARVQKLYDQKYAEMAAEDRVYWSQNDIPDLVAGALGRIIAEEICGGIGMQIPTETDNTDGKQVSIGTKGRRMLAKILARERTGLRTQAEYF